MHNGPFGAAAAVAALMSHASFYVCRFIGEFIRDFICEFVCAQGCRELEAAARHQGREGRPQSDGECVISMALCYVPSMRKTCVAPQRVGMHASSASLLAAHA